MFTLFDSTMFQILSPLFFLVGVMIVICLILVVIFSVLIFIKRLIFGFEDENNQDKSKKDKDAVVGFALKNNNIRRE